ncbi:Transcriptional regulator PadR-like family protein [Nonomuraea solani]|uniref:Transcriptional regulator PadR-like family protein n=1 Tax=Nonomuraea solani TaxID=1144553 RepID=A0A1H5XV16_9ACTN|nr:PadR family transcriptional regulator [Nonomuraea solani]SEG15571.1 Transcriptional regulator PadR-like family protein [Nonomuraea solani]
MSSTRLLVLGLLNEGPRHGYEINQLVTAGALEQWTDVKPGSIYHALAKLETEGLARTHAEERTGDRLRRVYAITDEGRRTLRDLLRKALAGPPHSTRSDFALALRWHTLLEDEVHDLIAASARELAARRSALAAGREAKAGLSPLADALFDNAEAHLAADAKLLDDLQRLIEVLH